MLFIILLCVNLVNSIYIGKWLSQLCVWFTDHIVCPECIKTCNIHALVSNVQSINSDLYHDFKICISQVICIHKCFFLKQWSGNVNAPVNSILEPF